MIQQQKYILLFSLTLCLSFNVNAEAQRRNIQQGAQSTFKIFSILNKSIKNSADKELAKDFKKRRKQIPRKKYRSSLAATSSENQSYPFSKSISCSTSGSVDINGEFTKQSNPNGSSTSATFDLNSCEGVDGTLTFLASAQYAKSKVSRQSTLDGNLNIDCGNGVAGTIETHLSFNSKFSYPPLSGSSTVSGTFKAICGNTSIPLYNCSWENIAITDSEALKAGCKGLGLSQLS